MGEARDGSGGLPATYCITNPFPAGAMAEAGMVEAKNSQGDCPSLRSRDTDAESGIFPDYGRGAAMLG